MAGASPEQIAQLKAKQPVQDSDFEVWPENWDSFAFFCRLVTQWNIVVGMESSQRTGLNYAAVEASMRMQSIAKKSQAALFEDIQLMEQAALHVYNSKKPD